jgi:hypothetical protein
MLSITLSMPNIKTAFTVLLFIAIASLRSSNTTLSASTNINQPAYAQDFLNAFFSGENSGQAVLNCFSRYEQTSINTNTRLNINGQEQYSIFYLLIVAILHEKNPKIKNNLSNVALQYFCQVDINERFWDDQLLYCTILKTGQTKLIQKTYTIITSQLNIVLDGLYADHNFQTEDWYDYENSTLETIYYLELMEKKLNKIKTLSLDFLLIFLSKFFIQHDLNSFQDLINRPYPIIQFQNRLMTDFFKDLSRNYFNDDTVIINILRSIQASSTNPRLNIVMEQITIG